MIVCASASQLKMMPSTPINGPLACPSFAHAARIDQRRLPVDQLAAMGGLEAELLAALGPLRRGEPFLVGHRCGRST